MLADSLIFRPLLPQLWIYAGAIALVLSVIAVLARTYSGRPVRAGLFALMRVALVIVIALVLLGPSRTLEPDDAIQPMNLVFAVDTSASMQTPDVGDRESRLSYAVRRWLSDEQIAKLRDRFRVSFVAFDDTRRTTTLDALRGEPADTATGSVTRLTASLSDAVLDTARGDVDTRMIVISDGHDTDSVPIGPVITRARERRVPVHTVVAGSSDAPADLAVIAQPRQEYLLVGEEGQIVVKVHRAGIERDAVSVRVQRGSEVSTHTARFAGRSTATVPLPIRHDEPGVYEYAVSVDALDEESVTANNEHRVFIDVIERSMRVLVLEGEPYWDTKFIANALRTDPRIELTHITQLAAGKREGVVTRVEDAAEPTPPTSIDEMRAYDVIILGRGIDRLMDAEALALLDDYVSDGGGRLVLARGRPYDPSGESGRAAAEAMSVIEPVVFATGVQRDVAVELTPAGMASPSFGFASVAESADRVVRALPPMATLQGVERVKPAAQVLARASRAAITDDDNAADVPAIVSMPVGRGRVFAVLGDGLWRWSLLPPDKRRFRGVFESFWSNTVRSLVVGGDLPPGERVALKLSRSTVRLGDPVIVDVIARVAPQQTFDPTARLTPPGGDTRTIAFDGVAGQANRKRRVLEPDAVGVWAVTLEPIAGLNDALVTRKFSVYDLDTERLDPSARPATMQQLAEETGGRFFRVTDDVDLAELLSRERIATQAPPRTEYTWDRAWVLFLILLWAGLEWIGRRASGWL